MFISSVCLDSDNGMDDKKPHMDHVLTMALDIYWLDFSVKVPRLQILCIDTSLVTLEYGNHSAHINVYHILKSRIAWCLL